MSTTIIQAIAGALERSGKPFIDEGRDELLDRIEKEFLPSGSGFDSGVTIDREKSSKYCIYLDFGYHHMNGDGYYTGWTKHRVTVRPSFDGIDMRITGRKGEADGYIKDTVYFSLMAQVEYIGTERSPDGLIKLSITAK